MNSEFIIIFILLLLILVLFYLIYNKKRFYENFSDTPSSLSLYKANNSSTFDKKMKDYMNTLSDINDLLLVYGCGINVGTAPYGLDKYINSAIKNSKIYRTPLMSVSSNDFKEVNSKIHHTILEFHDMTGAPIKGQIYVVISQAPFYRNDNNELVSIQYNAGEYLNNPTNLMTYKTSISNPIIQYHICLLFTAYNENREYIEDQTIRRKVVENIKKKFRYKESSCFLSCPNNKNLPCGCASQNKQDTNYDSICLETRNDANMSAGEKYTYAVLYKVNSKFADFTGREIIEDDKGEDYDWYPSSYDPIPVVKSNN